LKTKGIAGGSDCLQSLSGKGGALNIIVCYKLSPDAEDIQARPDGSLSFANAEWKIGQYDLVAVEAGAQLAETQGGTLTALSVGPKELENSKARKAILSRGPKDLVVVMDEALLDADTHLTAQTLAAAIRTRGDCDLVLCGEGSADLYAQQVGAQLGQLLGWPTINSVGKITPAGNSLVVERVLEDEVEVLEVPLPAVISVTTDINLPRIPGMKDILAAGKKPVTEWTLAKVGIAEARPALIVQETRAPKQADRKRLIREGESEDKVQALVSDLRKEGVL
jgi:electron transfer flavoprotein beta subunit